MSTCSSDPRFNLPDAARIVLQFAFDPADSFHSRLRSLAMSTWVAPSVAAEIWGMSVDHILAGIADGSIQSFVDGQFLFVDVEGRGFPISSPRPPVIEPTVSPEEIA